MTLAVARGGRESAVPGIEIRDVNVSFGQVRAVDHADLVVAAGEVSALIGDAGAGKSTLARTVAGLLAADSGAVRVCGIDTRADADEARARIGWVPQGAPTWPELTVLEALTAVADAQGLPTRRSRRRLHELVHLLRLRDVLDERTGDLAPSPRARLALAQALVHDPAVVVLDDLFDGLEAPDRIDIGDQLRRLAADGLTVLLIARTLEEVAGCAHRAYVMAGGRITAAHDLTEAPGALRWRIVSLDTDRLRQVLTLAGFEVEGADDEDERTPVDLDVDDEEEAVALLRTLVVSGVPILSFAPAPPLGSDATSSLPWWHP